MLEVAAHRLRTTRWVGRAPRAAVVAAGIALAAAGLRSVVESPAQAIRSVAAPAPQDLGSLALAEAFTRDYLTWTDGEPAADDALSAYGPEITPASTPGVRQTVSWTTVARVDRRAATTAVVTVVAQTSRGRYALAVTVARDQHGQRRVAGQPALVGAIPVPRRSSSRAVEREVDDSTLAAVAERVVRNYLARDRVDLVADLAADATVVLPDRRLDVRSTDAVTWVTPGRRIAATVRAVDRDRVEMTLRYELAVTRTAGRWLVRAIHTNPEVQ